MPCAVRAIFYRHGHLSGGASSLGMCSFSRLAAMRFWMRPRSTVRYALWISGLLVLLGGLFGMHGLDNHGGAGMDTVDHATMAGPLSHTAAAGHEAITGSVVAKAATVTPAVPGASRDAGMGMGAAGMCVAVLVVALIALLLRAHGGRSRPLLWMVSRPVRALGGRGRDPDPPSLIRLSIQRC